MMVKNAEEPRGLSVAAILAILFVTAVWGFNFIVIKVGVEGVPPLFLACLRFVFSVFPAIFFVKKPAVLWSKLAAYGLLIGVGEFGFLFTAIKLGAPAGLSSIILQAQAFFTVLLAALSLKQKIRANNAVGMIVACVGLALIGIAGQNNSALRFPFWLLAMVLLAAFFWAAANVAAQTMPKTDGLALVVWSSIFSPLPLFALSVLFEGAANILASLRNIQPISLGALAYLVVLSTLFGYGTWNHVIIRYGAGTVAPFSLLVPIFGVASSAIVLHEHISSMEAVAALLILAGLAIHVFGGRLTREKR